ncbi:MAG: helix-turn-helix transcriptional regulator [Mycobacteriaceae bacterium]
MTTSTARVFALLEILQAGGIRTVADLAGRFDVDERTIRRSVKHLVDLGVPVVSIRGRYGGYRLAPGYRMPPLMLTNEEALAVLLGLVSGRRSGLFRTSDAASESAAAKVRRVLPKTVARRLDAVLDTASFTLPPRSTADTEAEVLLDFAEAAQHRHPVGISYTDRVGRSSERTVFPYGVVAHSGRWYVTGADSASGDVRNFRLDRITAMAVQPGSFDIPAGFDAVGTVVTGLENTPWAHPVSLRIRDSVEHIRKYFPAGIATLTEMPDESSSSNAATSDVPHARSHHSDWVHVQLRAERLEWIPPTLAALDRPFVIEHPASLRDLIHALADRLAERADAGGPKE